MLIHAYSLALLFAPPVGLVALVWSRDRDTTLSAIALAAAFALMWGALQQWNINLAITQGRIERAKFHPIRPSDIVDSGSPRIAQNQPIQPDIPAIQPTEHVRLIPVNHYQSSRSTVMASDGRPLFPANKLIDGVPEADLRHFIELIPGKGGHQRSKWLGCVMPSGRKVDPEYYALLVAPLVKTKCIQGRAPRVAGVVTCSPQTMKQRLGLAP